MTGPQQQHPKPEHQCVPAPTIPPCSPLSKAPRLPIQKEIHPVIITSTITATDADNTNLASAVIAITSNYQNGEDVLSFTNTASITGSWNASTGQLSLSGSATIASYRSALRAVRYTNNSPTPSNLTRTVTFMVNDGTDNSNTQSRNISVNGTNIAPVLGIN